MCSRDETFGKVQTYFNLIHLAVGSKAAPEATMTATLKLKKMIASEATMTATLKLKR
jgi:hypothetical protein